MKIFDRYNIEHNFPRGVFLSPIGVVPGLDIQMPDQLPQELFIPVIPASDGGYELLVAEPAEVTSGTLLAVGLARVYSPCAGRVLGISSCYVPGFGESPALSLKPAADAGLTFYVENVNRGIYPEDASVEHVIDKIRQAGIISDSGVLVADVLADLVESHVSVVIANAAPPEPDFNTPAAILQKYPEKVYAGLAIVRRVLNASSSLLAYPWDMAIDSDYAEMWSVKTVQVSEKYPQYHPRALLETLRRRGLVNKQQYNSNEVFDIQTLALIERAVMADMPATARIVTVAGDALKAPGHYLLPIGMAVSDLLVLAGVAEDCRCVVAGRSLTGQAIDPVRTVVGPCCESFTVTRHGSGEAPDRCNRCGRCIEFCPEHLDPARLNELIEQGKFQYAEQNGLADCLECGLCSYCCCSGLKIHENIKMAKRMLKTGQK